MKVAFSNTGGHGSKVKVIKDISEIVLLWGHRVSQTHIELNSEFGEIF